DIGATRPQVEHVPATGEVPAGAEAGAEVENVLGRVQFKLGGDAQRRAHRIDAVGHILVNLDLRGALDRPGVGHRRQREPGGKNDPDGEAAHAAHGAASCKSVPSLKASASVPGCRASATIASS